MAQVFISYRRIPPDQDLALFLASYLCDRGHRVFIDSEITPGTEWAREVEDLGAGEILLTSKDADGTRDGFDTKMLREVTDVVSLPVIASGGCGKLEHFVDAVVRGHATAVLAASVFHFGDLTVEQVKRHMKRHGLQVTL